MARASKQEDHAGDLVRVGAAIRSIRKSKGLSQEALADAAGIDRSHMGKIERGERNVSFLNLLRVAHALGSKASDVLISGDL